MEIKCRNLLLRPWRIEDAKSLCSNANNNKVSENLRDIFPFPYTLEDAKYFITNIASATNNLILAMDVNGSAVGAIGIYPQSDIHRHNAEIGYWLGKHYWGRGVATEAVNVVVEYAFKNMGIQRIYASVFERNVASMRVLEKCGFVNEAIHYKSIVKNDSVMDEYIYSILNTNNRF